MHQKSENKNAALQANTNDKGPTSKSQREESTKSPTSHTGIKPTTLYAFFYYQLKRWRNYLFTKLPLIIPSILLMLLGFKELPKSVPLFNIMSQYPITSPIIGAILTLAILPVLVAPFLPAPKSNKKASSSNANRWWIVATGISTTSFLISSLLLATILVRPSSCPALLCPQQQVTTQAITNPQGVHDANLEVYPITVQGDYFVIPGNPPAYSLNDLPQTIGAVHLDKKAPSSLYRIVLGVHSLQQGHYNLLIMQVALDIKRILFIPPSLNVWAKGSPIDYHANPYLAVYKGQGPGDVLPATYTPLPYAHVQLAPGEADQLDIQVSSQVTADVQFSVQITYRIANEAQLHTLSLPQTAEVIFSDETNWHEYQIQNGHFS